MRWHEGSLLPEMLLKPDLLLMFWVPLLCLNSEASCDLRVRGSKEFGVFSLLLESVPLIFTFFFMGSGLRTGQQGGANGF